MESKFRIVTDIEGQATAVVEIDGTEYTVKLNTIGMPTAERNKRIRELAEEQARDGQ